MVNISSTGMSSRDFAPRLSVEKFVAFVPSDTFGIVSNSYVWTFLFLSEVKIDYGLK